jgi:hypothetical protein
VEKECISVSCIKFIEGAPDRWGRMSTWGASGTFPCMHVHLAALPLFTLGLRQRTRAFTDGPIRISDRALSRVRMIRLQLYASDRGQWANMLVSFSYLETNFV